MEEISLQSESRATVLYVRFNACFACLQSTLQMRKERMWGSYHCLRSADKMGESFSVKMKAFPSFYQFESV